MNISVLLLRPSKSECGTVASFQFGGVKRRKGLGVTVPTDRWDKNRQRIKVSGSLHRDERTFLMGLNKRIEHHVKAIQDAVHILTYELEREPTWEELSAALDRLNAGKENINETTLTFYQWVEEFITESEEHRTNAKGQKLHPRTIAKYRTVLTQLKDFARGHLGRGMKFEDWNQELVNRYKSFRASQGCKVSTIGKDLAVIKVWLKKAHHRKLHDNRSYLEPYFVPPKHRGLVEDAVESEKLHGKCIAASWLFTGLAELGQDHEHVGDTHKAISIEVCNARSDAAEIAQCN